MKFNEKEFINRVAVTCHTIVSMVLILAYVMEWIKGARSVGYMCIVFVFMGVPLIIEWVLQSKRPDNVYTRHIMALTYSVFYIFAIFTTNSMLTFVYAIPMFVAITIYSDVRYCALISIGGFVSNIAYIAYHAIKIGYATEEIPDAEIRIACMVLVGIFMVLTTRANKKIGEERMKAMQEEQGKTENLLNNILQVSDGMTTDIAGVSEKMDMLGESVNRIREAMSEVSGGSTETAESIQNQMYQTEQIQGHIAKVKHNADFIEKNVDETVRVVGENRAQMDVLAANADEAARANSRVIEKMEELNECTKQMNTIIETITSIANSTGMLALNASIEAARAGEAGRGFSVVASEISGLASQTKNATVDITGLIESITRDLANAAEAVNEVAVNSQKNAESTRAVAESFTEIVQGADKIKTQVVELGQTVTELEEANNEIVDKIQTISAITEEVSAHSNETYSDCEQNARMVSEIVQIVDNLNQNAGKLQEMK